LKPRLPTGITRLFYCCTSRRITIPEVATIVKNSARPGDNDICEMYAVHGIVRSLYLAGNPHYRSNLDPTGSVDATPAMHAARLADENALREADSDHAMRHFGFVLNDKVVSGSLPVVGFKDGDKIAAVVMDAEDPVLHAIAVFRQEDGLLWMPYCADRGRYAALFWMAKIASYAILAISVCMSPLFYFYPIFGGFLETALGFAGLEAILATIILTFMCFAGGEGEYGEQIMKVLGFKRPRFVNLAPFSVRAMRSHETDYPDSRYVYRLVPALIHYDCLPAWHPANEK
jgi:hypothetical protein